MSISSSSNSYEINSLLTTKGDILINNGTSLSRLAAGTNGYTLTANSSAISGSSWSVAPSGGTASYVPIGQSVVTANINEVSITNIPNTYKAIGIVAVSRDTASGQRDLYIRFNSSTAGNYSYLSRAYTSGTGYNFQGSTQSRLLLDGVGAAGTSNWGYLHMTIQQYATTNRKYGLYYGGGTDGSNKWVVQSGNFSWILDSAISSVQFLMDPGAPTVNRIATGSVFYVYGIK